MALNDILVFKRTVIVPKKADLPEVVITNAIAIGEVSGNLVLRNASNGFYTYDVVIKAKQIAAAGITNFKFIITNSQNDIADVDAVIIGAVSTDTLLDTHTVRADSVNNVLSTHTLSVYADVT